MLYKNIKTFFMYIIFLNLIWTIIYLAKKAKIALLLIKIIKILIKYSNFSHIFSKKNTLVLL